MTAIKLKLAPGIYKNGTEYQAAGRWLECNLIRWQNDNIKTINGWQKRADFATGGDLAPLWGGEFDEAWLMDAPTAEPLIDAISGDELIDQLTPSTGGSGESADEAARSGIVTSDATDNVNVYVGTNKQIYKISNSNVVTNVTPVGFVEQDRQSAFSTGYGLYRYSYGRYGTPRPSTAVNPKPAFSWGFTDWGFWPVACARRVAGEKLKVKRDTDSVFVDIPNSPAGTFDVVVTDERIMMTVGTPTDFRRVQWSDMENFDVWTPAISNQAGSRTLAGVGRLLCANRCLGKTLIISESDAFVASYIGPPYIYGFNRIGTQCGIIGAEAIGITDTFAAWIGNRTFWIYDGVLRPLPCDILDFYLKDHNRPQRSKTVGFTVSDFSEIWWLYQSNQSVTDEPDSYIIYNHAKNIWYNGRLDRTLGLDANPLIYPLMVSSSGRVYDHEVQSAGYDGALPYIASGPLETANGSKLTGIQYVYPDEQLSGDVLMELSVRPMPNQPITYTRTFNLLSPTSTHGIMGRDIRMKLAGAGVNPQWVVGDFRVLPLQNVVPQR